MGTGAATPPEPPGRQSAKRDMRSWQAFACFDIEFILLTDFGMGLPIQAGRPSRTFSRGPSGAKRSMIATASGQKDDLVAGGDKMIIDQ